jgi:hypothetical protein
VIDPPGVDLHLMGCSGRHDHHVTGRERLAPSTADFATAQLTRRRVPRPLQFPAYEQGTAPLLDHHDVVPLLVTSGSPVAVRRRAMQV